MNLKKKRILAAKTLGVGKDRIVFDSSHLAEIKEAISKQDIRDFFDRGIISIRKMKGRRAVMKRKTRKRSGSIRKRIKGGKKRYATLTRKLRAYLSELKKKNQISLELYGEIRKEIKASMFKSKSHLKEHVGSLEKKIT
jgi:ribosomal protein L19E